MTDPSKTPVVVGVADRRHACHGRPADPLEPLALIVNAAEAALADTGSPGVGAAVDTVHAVRTSSWSYADLPALVTEHIGAKATRTHTSPVGGHWPAALLDRLAADIAAGSTRVALLVGGEAQASVTSLMKAGTDPASLGWVTAPGGPPAFDPDDLGSADMQRAGMITPTRVYPLFENRLGADLGETPNETRARSARMYAAFSAVATAHPVAWAPGIRSAHDIATAGPGNRLVSDAYPLAMNAMPFVDQAAAVVVCSLAAAREYGVPDSRIIYLWGGAGASDTPDILARSTFGASPALESATERTLRTAALSSSDLAIVDSYSCFPVVPALVVRTLGLSADFVPTVLGGHSYFGGPLSSYTLHSIVEVTRRLRHSPPSDVALVHGNGGYLTHQHVILMSGRAHRNGYIGDPIPRLIPPASDAVHHDYCGDAEIVTATIEFDRAATPTTGLVIARTPEGQRVAGHTDPEGAAALVRFTAEGSRSLVGAAVHITDHGGRLTVDLSEQVNR